MTGDQKHDGVNTDCRRMYVRLILLSCLPPISHVAVAVVLLDNLTTTWRSRCVHGKQSRQL